MRGSHLIKSWSSTQNNAISLSSGEAELYAIVKGLGTGLGVQQFLEDLGESAALRLHTDSAAAQGICKRVGLGTQRHVAVNSLWVQEKLRRKEFALFKIKGTDDPADLMTKHLPSDQMVKPLRFMGAEYRTRRIIAFLNPWEDPLDTGFQVIQSFYAFGRGGIFGTGIGASHQKLF